MRKLLVVVFVLFFVKLVPAVSVDFDCPNEVSVDEEFECSLAVSDGEGVYDVKVEIRKDNKDVAKIYDEDSEKWSSAYYYLKEFIESGDDKELSLKVSEEGDYDGVLKIRQGDKREFFDFEISVVGDFEEDEETEKVVEEKSEPEKPVVEEVITLNEPPKEIFLNNLSEVKTDLVYESKNFRVLNCVPYAFCVFLIFLIGVILRDR